MTRSDTKSSLLSASAVTITAAFILVCLSSQLTLPVDGHSWIGCTDYRGDVSMYEEAKCYGWPRDFAQYFSNTPKTSDGYNLAADMGYNYNSAEKSCGISMTSPVSAAYSSAYPMATYEQGGTYCLAHPTKNHVAAQCTNEYIPDTLMAIYRSGVNPTSDPDQATFFQNRVKDNYGTHVNAKIDCLGFQRSPKFCTNTGSALATGCITLPADLPVGRYTFQWFWQFNSAAAGDTYHNCWDVNVVAKGAGRGSGGLTGIANLVDNLTPAGDTCRKNWAAVGNPPAPGEAPPAPIVITTSSTGSNSGGGGGSTNTGSSSTTTGTTNTGGTNTGGTTNTGTVSASILWQGLFAGYSTAADFNAWSWSTQLGEYKAYIFGNELTTQKMSDYLQLGAQFANPADSAFAAKGLAVSIDGSSSWSDQPMLRTELVANIKNDVIQTGKRFFHFSMMQPSATTALKTANEHQLVFFEPQFCVIKYGIGTSNLQFWANWQLQWSVAFSIGTWHKFAFGVDFDAKTCELYYAGAGATSSLTRVSGPHSIPSIAPGDFHLGNLRLPLNNVQDPAKETLYYSSVFISKDAITTTPAATSSGGTNSDAANGGGSGSGSLGSAASVRPETSTVALLLAAIIAVWMA